MILYFTGTGNSKFVADYIAECLGDETVSLNDVIRNSKPLKFHSERPFVVVAPIYAWRFPQIIEKLLMEADFSGNKSVYFVGTMGSQSGNSDKYLMKIMQEHNMKFMGFCGIAMPNNYVYGGRLPDKNEAYAQIKSAIPEIKSVSDKIASGKSIVKTDKTPFSGFLSGTVNNMFNKHMISSKNFNVSEKCISCGKCVKECPVNNIEMKEGAPVFKEKCLNCYSCINRCPKEAINIGNRTQKNGRYVCPEYSEWKKQN
ncbi:MAG: 4Fe-4S dicluster domain-containing protein [Ruminococcus sp.]|nr:4Fe-4S dicluster domain-containing protein [Ruminococcus sp.]